MQRESVSELNPNPRRLNRHSEASLRAPRLRGESGLLAPLWLGGGACDGYHRDPMPKYHLRQAELEIVDQAELEAVLRRGRYMTVAMCRDGEPYVVTLSYGYSAGENVLYCHCARDGLKLDFLRATPEVCATVVEDLGYKSGECAHAYRSVVVRGLMEVVETRAQKAHGLRVLLAHQESDPLDVERRLLPDDAAYDRVTVLRLDIREITGKQSV